MGLERNPRHRLRLLRAYVRRLCDYDRCRRFFRARSHSAVDHFRLLLVHNMLLPDRVLDMERQRLAIQARCARLCRRRACAHQLGQRWFGIRSAPRQAQAFRREGILQASQHHHRLYWYRADLVRLVWV